VPIHFYTFKEATAYTPHLCALFYFIAYVKAMGFNSIKVNRSNEQTNTL